MKGTLYIFSLVLLGITMSFISCKDKTPDPAEPQKTLDKSKLYDKEWYVKDETFYTHLFYSNGDYGFDGSWKWLNNSDSMELIQYSGAPKRIWTFKYCTDTELACRAGTQGEFVIYKTEEW